MSNFYNSNYPSYPQYPGNDNRAPYPGSDNIPPYPIGFEGLNGNNFPQYPPQDVSYPQYNNGPSSIPSYPSAYSNDGFPVAPSSSSHNYPPQSSYPSYNPPPSNYPSSQNSYLPFNQPFSNYPSKQNSFPSYNQPPSNYPSSNQGYPQYVPPVPSYQPDQPEFQPNQSFQNSQSGSSLYPNLVPNSFNQTQAMSVSNPTLRPAQPFNPAQDAEQLYKAMKGFGTNETKLIDVLCKRTYAQREEISLVYKTSYGKDLIKNIESETSGDFKTLLVTLLTKSMAVEAKHLKESIQGLGTDEEKLIDVICTKTNAQMLELKQTYAQMYRRNIEDEVKGDVSGYFKRLLISLMTGHRSEAPADYEKAVQQAKELYQAGENKLGTDEVVFNRIISLESHEHLRLVFDEYQKLTRHPIEQAIRSEMSSSVQRAFLTVIQIIRKPASYYAKRLKESMEGIGTKDKLLIRLVVLRSEIDMMDIKSEFQKMFGKSLESWIKSDCSGDYKRALLCLIGDPNWK